MLASGLLTVVPEKVRRTNEHDVAGNDGGGVQAHRPAIFFHPCGQNRLLLEESGQSFLKVFLCIFWKRDFESRGKEAVCR